MDRGWVETLASILGGCCCLAVYVPLGVLMWVEIRRSIALYWKAGRDLLDEWAADQGWTVVRAEPAWLGPWVFRSSIQRVFRLTVYDRSGRRRTGWALCGGYLVGVYARRVEV